MYSYCSSQVPNFKIDRFPKSKYDVGGGLCKVPERRKSLKKCKGGCSCDIDTQMLHMSDQLPHGATKFQKRLKAKHDAAKIPAPIECNCKDFDTNSTEESEMNNVPCQCEPERNVGGFDEKLQTQKIEESCAEFLNIIQDAVLDTVQKCMRSILKENIGRLECKVDAICSHVAKNSHCVEEMSKDYTKQMNKMNLKNDVRFKCLCEFLFEHIGNKDVDTHESLEQLEKEESVDSTNTMCKEMPTNPCNCQQLDKEESIESKITARCKEMPTNICICKHIKTEFVDVVPTMSARHSRHSTMLADQSCQKLRMTNCNQQKNNIRNPCIFRSKSLDSTNKLKERLQSLKRHRELRESLACNSNEKQAFNETCRENGNEISTPLCCCSKNEGLNEKGKREEKSRNMKSRNSTCCCCSNEPNNSTQASVNNCCPECLKTANLGCKKTGSRSSLNRSIKFNASVSTCCQRQNESTSDHEQYCSCKPFENEKNKRSHGGYTNSTFPEKIKRSERCVEYIKKKTSRLTTEIPQDNTDDLLRVCKRERKRRQKRLTSPYNTPYLQLNDKENVDFPLAINEPDERVRTKGSEKSSLSLTSFIEEFSIL